MDGKFPFLDLLIKRIVNNLTFEIYRKKSYTYFPMNFNNSWQHIMATWNCMICRLINIPINKEIEYKEN